MTAQPADEVREDEVREDEPIDVDEPVLAPGDPMPGSGDDFLLEARGVSRRFGGLMAVRDVNLAIPKQAIVSIIGPNGAGKTTFFNVIAGITDPTTGTVSFDGRVLVTRPRRVWLESVVWVLPSIIALAVTLPFAIPAGEPGIFASSAMALGLLIVMLVTAIARPIGYQRLLARLGIIRSARPNDVAAAGIGRTFQNIRLFQNMTVIENVLVGMHLQMKTNLVDHLIASRRQAREEEATANKARELLRLVGLRGRENELAKNLPYGDQRRLEVARALANKPALVLLDEPTAGMNPRETSEMTALVGRLRKELGISVLLIEHDMKVVMGVSDRITVLDHGERIAEGTPEEVRRDPRVIEAYLGKPAT